MIHRPSDRRGTQAPMAVRTSGRELTRMAVDRRTLAAILIACSALLAASPAAASANGRRQIDVFPGPHALSKALAQASSGDALELHTGTYLDDVAITLPRSRSSGPETVP